MQRSKCARVVGATGTRVLTGSDIHISGDHVVIDGTDLKPGHTYSILMEPGALSSSTLRPFGLHHYPFTVTLLG